MRYMLLIYMKEDAMTESERQDCYVKSAGLARDLHQNGQFISAAPLHPVAVATSVQVREGRRLVTDGPFAETREQLGGYFMINADNLDEAMVIAEQIPAAKLGTVEIRPVLEIPGVPS